MAEVFDFPKSEPMYWHCNCGCSTFFVRDDGQFECPHCETTVDESKTEKVAAGELDHFIQTNVPEDIVRHQYSKAILEDDLAAAVLLYNSGRVRTWGARLETRAERGWFNRRIAVAKATLTGDPLP